MAESGIVGTAVGLALRGYRPVVEIQFDGFVYPAYDQIVCQVAKYTYRSLGKVRMPIVIRIPFGGGIGAVEHHSESPEAQFAHTPGLKVYVLVAVDEIGSAATCCCKRMPLCQYLANQCLARNHPQMRLHQQSRQ